MDLKFTYTLLIATNAFKRELLDILTAAAEVPGISSVVVINGEDCDNVRQRYLDATRFRNAQFLSTPVKGKSLALNLYIRELEDPRVFLIFTDDDIEIDARVFHRYIETVEQRGTGYYYGGGVDVAMPVEIDAAVLSLYPASIKGVSDNELSTRKIFLGCNWGAFAADIRAANYFSPYFGPGSITGSVGQESQMMHKLLRLGRKPFPVADCRVTHYAPKDYHTLHWLYHRNFRGGIEKGLLNRKKIAKVVALKVPKLFKGSRARRKSHFYSLMGILYSIKFYFRKID